jgi:site-specific DNA-methyltransferase (adenine-specific)
MDPDAQREWLARAAEGKWKTRQLKDEIRDALTRDRIATMPTGPGFTVISGDFRTAEIEPESVDWIITDPPYPAEFLPLYSDLSAFAERVLKPGGSLVAMVGQSYLPAIMAQLGERLTYQWTLAYLTPGGQAVQLWERKVNTFWKPLLWYVKGEYAGGWVGDVTRSNVNDNDKRFHGWGQSESGMADIVERFTEPGELIVDPFGGGMTTGIVAEALGRRFIGIEIDTDLVPPDA